MMAQERDFAHSRSPSANGLTESNPIKPDMSSRDSAVEDPHESFIEEHFLKRPRSMSHHLQSQKVPSRRRLKTQARIWRRLMRLGMLFHGWCPPKPPRPDFVRKIETDTVPIEMLFYVPSDYSLSSNDDDAASSRRWPMIVNFHGGGFTMGDATDDRYFARVVLEQTKAVFISVNYRLAPEHPFPQPVDDCVEVLMWLSSHATELRLDPRKTALTGFSAGGNLSFTVPFRLTYHTNPSKPRKFASPESALPSATNTPSISRVPTSQTITAGMNPEVTDKDELNPRSAPAGQITLQKPVSHDKRSPSLTPQRTPADSRSHLLPADSRDDGHEGHVHFRKSQADPHTHPDHQQSTHLQPRQEAAPRAQRAQRPGLLSRQTTLNIDRPSNLRIVSIVAFYPLLDWTSSRSAKVRSSRKPSATLKKTFTDLFDHSYLPPPDDAKNHISPFASPGLAPSEMIREGLPTKIQIFLCEYDMLLAEGDKFVDRLRELGKDVYTEMINGVPHGWDKSPNPFRKQKHIDELYVRSMRELQKVFDDVHENPEEFRGDRIGVGGLK